MGDNEVSKSIVTSYRLKEDTKDKIKAQLKDLDLTQEEYFNKVVAVMELERVKTDSIFAVNTQELQDLTQRIYNLFIGLCEQGNSFLTNKDIELRELKNKYKDMLSDKEESIAEQKHELQEAYNSLEVLQKQNDKYKTDVIESAEGYKSELSNIKEQYNIKIEQMERNLQDKISLIEELRDKNDDLTGKVNEYKSYKSEVETQKELLADAQARIINQDNLIKEKDFIINGLNKTLEDLKFEKEKAISELTTKQKDEIKAIRDKADYEKNIMALELKQAQQEQIQNINQHYNAKIEEYQADYKALLDRIRTKQQPNEDLIVT